MASPPIRLPSAGLLALPSEPRPPVVQFLESGTVPGPAAAAVAGTPSRGATAAADASASASLSASKTKCFTPPRHLIKVKGHGFMGTTERQKKFREYTQARHSHLAGRGGALMASPTGAGNPWAKGGDASNRYVYKGEDKFHKANINAIKGGKNTEKKRKHLLKWKKNYSVEHRRGSTKVLGRLQEILNENMQRVVDVFQNLDVNGDGSLEPAEFGSGLRALDVPFDTKHALALYALLDVDGDGTIDYKELIQGLREQREGRLDDGDPETDALAGGAGAGGGGKRRGPAPVLHLIGPHFGSKSQETRRFHLSEWREQFRSEAHGFASIALETENMPVEKFCGTPADDLMTTKALRCVAQLTAATTWMLIVARRLLCDPIMTP